MYYEVVRGRACDSLQAVQATLIQSQGKQLLNQDNALKLAVSLADTKEAEVQELRQAFTKLEDKSNLETKQLKKQRFKLVLIAIGEAVLIVLLL